MTLIQAERDTLLKPLQSVTGIVERRHTLPILSNVLIEASGEGLSFIATDLEIQITSRVANLNPGQTFSLTVAARKLQDILRALPESAQPALDADEARLAIRAGKSRFNLQTLPAADFPKLEMGAGVRCKLSLPQKQLKSMLHQVQYAMAQQDMRFYLNGLYVLVEDGHLKLVATDGHRLSHASCALEPHQVEFMDGEARHDVILPRKAVGELVKLLSGGDAPIEIQMSRTQVAIRFEGIDLVSKVIDGKFPDYTRVIPVNYEKEVVIERQALLAAMQRAAILSNEKFRGVRLTLANDTLRIACTNSEQEEAEEEMEISYGWEPLDIGFNVTYLLDVLNNFDGDSVQLAFGDANASCLITLPGDDRFKYVVMPMRI